MSFALDIADDLTTVVDLLETVTFHHRGTNTRTSAGAISESGGTDTVVSVSRMPVEFKDERSPNTPQGTTSPPYGKLYEGLALFIAQKNQITTVEVNDYLTDADSKRWTVEAVEDDHDTLWVMTCRRLP